MKGIFKKAVGLSLALAFSFGLVACGGGEDDGGQVTIIVPDSITSKVGLNAWEKQRQEEFKKAYPNIKLDTQNNPTTDPAKNIQAMITNLSNEATAFTLLKANSNTYARSVYQSELTEDMSKYLTEEELAQFDPQIMQGYYDGDELVGIPFRLEYPLLGFNRKHLYAEQVKINLGIDPAAADANAQVEAKIDAIETWDDFAVVAKALSGSYTVSGSMKTVSGYGGYLTDYYIGLGVWNVANGHTTVTQHESGKMDIDLSNQQTLETVQFMQRLKKDGALTHNVNLGYTDFFNKIYANEIASFIYYPSWSTSQFEPNGIRASDIKVINIPYGPSIQAKMEAKESDPSIEIPSTNVCFSLSYVLNKRASEEQKKAAIQYILFMHGKDALLDKIEFAREETIPMLTVPPYTFDDEYLTSTLFANVPNDWKASLTDSIHNYYVFDQGSDMFITYIASNIPGIVNGSDQFGTYDTEAKTKARLQQLNELIYSEFLNGYNSNF